LDGAAKVIYEADEVVGGLIISYFFGLRSDECGLGASVVDDKFSIAVGGFYGFVSGGEPLGGGLLGRCVEAGGGVEGLRGGLGGADDAGGRCGGGRGHCGGGWERRNWGKEDSRIRLEYFCLPGIGGRLQGEGGGAECGGPGEGVAVGVKVALCAAGREYKREGVVGEGGEGGGLGFGEEIPEEGEGFDGEAGAGYVMLCGVGRAGGLCSEFVVRRGPPAFGGGLWPEGVVTDEEGLSAAGWVGVGG